TVADLPRRGGIGSQPAKGDRIEQPTAHGAVKALAAAVVSIAVLTIGTAHATDPEVKGQQKKLKARGKTELGRKRNRAKVLGGGTDMAAACQAKFSGALTKAGTACRFLDNGDGTVSDLDTGLVWEKKDNSDGTGNLSDPRDADNAYNWSASGTATDGTV